MEDNNFDKCFYEIYNYKKIINSEENEIANSETPYKIYIYIYNKNQLAHNSVTYGKK